MKQDGIIILVSMAHTGFHGESARSPGILKRGLNHIVERDANIFHSIVHLVVFDHAHLLCEEHVE